MFKTYQIFVIILATTYACQKASHQIEIQEQEKVDLESRGIDSNTVLLAQGSNQYVFGKGIGGVEPGIKKKYFVEVVVKVDEGSTPFLLGWETQMLVPGDYEGEWLNVLIEQKPSVFLNSGPYHSGTFSVKLDVIGGVGEEMTGSFKGMGSTSGSTQLVPFDGIFHAVRKS